MKNQILKDILTSSIIGVGGAVILGLLITPERDLVSVGRIVFVAVFVATVFGIIDYRKAIKK